MRKSYKLLVLIFCAFLNGCNSALLSMRAENKQIEQNLPVLQQRLNSINYQNQLLEIEKNNLNAALNEKNTSIDELAKRISKLQAENSKIKTATEEQRRKKVALTQRLNQFSAKIKTFKKRETRLTNSEKIKQIEDLKQQIRDNVKQNADLFNN